MTCYFRHLERVFEKAGIQVTTHNKKQVDRLIHSLVKTTYKDCPNTWREVKNRIAQNEVEFAQKLKSEWEKIQT